ncbi:MAG: hypothetical protein U1E14_14200 [Geminicoccaceae bacterium]
MPDDLTVASVAAAEPVTTRQGGSRPAVPARQALEAATSLAAGSGLDAAVGRAASGLYPDRSVQVSSFVDGASGRSVYRVADRVTGEVLMQSPAEELLRFYASSRAALERPLLAIDA